MRISYLEFFLDCIAIGDNISFLYCVAQTVKEYEDAYVDASLVGAAPFVIARVCLILSWQNIYILSDLAQITIQERAHSHQWPLTNYPGEIYLPANLFKDSLSDQQKAEVGRTHLLLQVIHLIL